LSTAGIEKILNLPCTTIEKGKLEIAEKERETFLKLPYA